MRVGGVIAVEQLAPDNPHIGRRFDANLDAAASGPDHFDKDVFNRRAGYNTWGRLAGLRYLYQDAPPTRNANDFFLPALNAAIASGLEART